MAAYLVCDGGGSKTEFLIFRDDGTPLAYARRGGTSAYFFRTEGSVTRVLEGVESCLKKAGLSPSGIDKTMLFIPGFRSCKEYIVQKLGQEVFIEGDEKSAFYAALGQPFGIAVLSGTGSFAAGRTRDGREAKSGGWGPLFGDKGSGYHIGILCLEKLAWLQDNQISGTKLEELVLAYLHAPDIESIRHSAYQSGYGRELVSGLCPIVAQAACQNDPYALEILERAAYALMTDVMTVAGRLRDFCLPVALTGGVTHIGPLFINFFRTALETTCPTLIWKPSMYEPILGAALCLLTEQAHIQIENNKLINNLMHYKAGDLQC